MENGKVRQFMASEGLDPVGSSPEELAAQVRKEIAKYATVIHMADIKLQ
jgi:tripartite-type tricarboxylate transporter receptor subunit TctC